MANAYCDGIGIDPTGVYRMEGLNKELGTWDQFAVEAARNAARTKHRLHRKQQVDKMSATEKLQMLWEDTDRQLQQYRVTDQDEMKNQVLRMGKGLWHNQFIRMVTAINTGIWAEDSLADKGNFGLYRSKNDPLLGTVKEYLAAAQKGFMPEFSFVITDAADLPVSLRKGWRAVLTMLLAKKALTWSQVLDVFGTVHYGDSRGKYWRAYTNDYRS